MTKLKLLAAPGSMLTTAVLLFATGQAQALQCTKACTCVGGQCGCELICKDGSRWVPAPSPGA